MYHFGTGINKYAFVSLKGLIARIKKILISSQTYFKKATNTDMFYKMCLYYILFEFNDLL